MQNITTALNQARNGVFHRWKSAGMLWKITGAVLTACLIGLLAQVRIPFFPVPFTGQTFAVLMAGVLLGRRWGGASMAIYAVLGLAGVPWFSGLTSGFGATSGYLVGFVLAALFLGYVIDRKPEYRSFGKMFGLMLFAGLVLVYLPGMLWLGFWMSSIGGDAVTIASVFAAGALPFIAGDIVKAGAAAALARVITSKELSSSI
ncbi:MAG: biotin transporter BioY [Dehalococcoidia bacterium]|nr:biotin transporter BioY [Dehalococcoidia bacterium]